MKLKINKKYKEKVQYQEMNKIKITIKAACPAPFDILIFNRQKYILNEMHVDRSETEGKRRKDHQSAIIPC